MEIYFERDYARIRYYSSDHHIIYEWLIPPTNDEFKEGCEKLLLAIKHFKTGKAIIDIRLQGAVHPEVIQWMTSDWMIRAASAGYTHAAVIASSDIFTRMSADEIIGNSNKLVIHQYFDNTDSALDWIKKQSASAGAAL